MSALTDLLNRYNEADKLTNIETLVVIAMDETAAEELAALRDVKNAALKWRNEWPDEEDIREAQDESCPCSICQLIVACDAMKGDA